MAHAQSSPPSNTPFRKVNRSTVFERAGKERTDLSEKVNRSRSCCNKSSVDMIDAIEENQDASRFGLHCQEGMQMRMEHTPFCEFTPLDPFHRRMSSGASAIWTILPQQAYTTSRTDRPKLADVPSIRRGE